MLPRRLSGAWWLASQEQGHLSLAQKLTQLPSSAPGDRPQQGDKGHLCGLTVSASWGLFFSPLQDTPHPSPALCPRVWLRVALSTFWVTNRRTNLSSWGTEDSGTSSEVSGSGSALLLPRGHLAPGYRLQQCRCGKWGLSQSISWAWACTAHLLEGVLSCAHHPFLHEAVFQYSGQSWMTRGLCVWSSFHL